MNQAYDVLKKPLRRAHYIVSYRLMRGGDGCKAQGGWAFG